MMSSPNHDHLLHFKIPLQYILEATNNFGEDKITEEADFGNVYTGQLFLWSGESIKIDARRFNKDEWDDEKEQQFWMEIFMLSTLTHKNLVSFVGFCDENDERIIIIMHETRGSLENHLSDSRLLTWVRRLEICVDLAMALSYLRYDEHRDFSVIHRNIDSETILLNDNWEPKLSEFRLSMKIEASERHDSFCVNKVWDRKGYTDPTYLETKSAHHKSDMYSFGIVMFELLCGRKSISEHPDNKYLTPMAIFHYKEKTLDDIMDPELWKQMDPQSFNVFAQTAYDCLNEERSQRPDIGEVVTRLEEALKLQMQRQNAEHSIVAAEVEVTSSNHDKGSLTSISTQVESHGNKKTKSFLKDLSHLKLSWEHIASATNNFARENIIRTFWFGLIYKGRLLHSEQFIHIIVKRFYTDCIKDESKKIWTEILMLSSLKHKNLVSLIGIFDDGINKMIIYKKEANRSLKTYLSDETLTWMQRWEPKLSGFEISLKNTVARRQHLLLTRDIVKNVYLDPKYKMTGGVTHKSDVYSLGVVLLEVLRERSAVDDE
ncbi:kinase-like domain, phloem protein 2-like protein [Tanacetum coccineum]